MVKLQGRKQEKGFTIIELVVVILLLGILTATALPRFMDVTDEAHDAVVNGVISGLQTSSGLFRASWFAEGQNKTVNDYAAMYANTSGYALGLGTNLVTGTDCQNIFETFLQAPGRPTLQVMSTTGALEFTDLSAASADFKVKAEKNKCHFAYMGQFKDTVTGTNPVIDYDATTGIFSLGTEL